MKRKELKLEVLEAPEQDFLMYSIFSYLNDYHLCWEINQKFGIRLSRCNDYVIDRQKTSERAFSVYHFFSQEERRTYLLVSNKSEYGPLMLDLPKVDYFFRISGLIEGIDEKEVFSKFRKIENVMMTMNAENHSLNKKGKEQLINIFEELCQ